MGDEVIRVRGKWHEAYSSHATKREAREEVKDLKKMGFDAVITEDEHYVNRWRVWKRTY